MHKLLFVLAVGAIAALAIWTVSCGATSPCQDLLYKICDCEYAASKDAKAKDSCYTDADKASFSAAQDTECSKYKDTCNCNTYKGDTAATSCPANFGG